MVSTFYHTADNVSIRRDLLCMCVCCETGLAIKLFGKDTSESCVLFMQGSIHQEAQKNTLNLAFMQFNLVFNLKIKLQKSSSCYAAYSNPSQPCKHKEATPESDFLLLRQELQLYSNTPTYGNDLFRCSNTAQ